MTLELVVLAGAAVGWWWLYRAVYRWLCRRWPPRDRWDDNIKVKAVDG